MRRAHWQMRADISMVLVAGENLAVRSGLWSSLAFASNYHSHEGGGRWLPHSCESLAYNLHTRTLIYHFPRSHRAIGTTILGRNLSADRILNPVQTPDVHRYHCFEHSTSVCVWVAHHVITMLDSSLERITRMPRMIYGSLVLCSDPSRCYSDMAQFSCKFM